MDGRFSVSLDGNPDSESYEKSSQTILEEVSLSNQDLTKQDVIVYAKLIGIDPDLEPDLLWIARKGLLADLPPSWIPVQDSLGRIYYYNKKTGKSTWHHPVDRYLRSFVRKKRLDLNQRDPGRPMNRPSPLANLRFLDDDLSFPSGGKNKINKKPKKSRKDEDQLTLSSIGDDEEDDIDSIQFELDEEAFNALDDSEEDQVTLDITEGGPCDVKNFHEIHRIDLEEKNSNQDEAPVRPKSGKPRLIESSKETKDDSSEDSFSLKSMDHDPFGGDDSGLFQKPIRSGQDPTIIPAKASSGPLETLEEEQDEDVIQEVDEGNPEDEDEFEDDEQAKEEDEEEEKDEVEMERIDQEKLEKEFHELSDRLRLEISKLREETFLLVKEQNQEVTKQISDRFQGIETRLENNEKTLNTLKEKIPSKMTNQTATSFDSNEISKLKKDVEAVSRKVDKIEDDCKKSMEKEIIEVKKNLTEVKDEFQMIMDQFRDFKKDNDLTIKAMRKQLTQVSSGQETLTEKTSEIQNDLQQLVRDVSQKRTEGGQPKALREEFRQSLETEREERQRLARVVDDMREMVFKEVGQLDRALKRKDEDVRGIQEKVSVEFQETKCLLTKFRGQLEEMKQIISEEKIREDNSRDQAQDDTEKEDRLALMEKSLQAINEKLDQIKLSKEREKIRGMASRRKQRKIPSSCSSYEESLTSSGEVSQTERMKPEPETIRKKRTAHSNSRPNNDNYGKRREYIKYSPLHFSPILITGESRDSRHRDFKTSAASLLTMIRRTSRLLKEETSELDGLGNYRFVSDMSNGGMFKSDMDADENAIRKLRQLRCDIDEKLNKLNSMINRTSNQS